VVFFKNASPMKKLKPTAATVCLFNVNISIHVLLITSLIICTIASNARIVLLWPDEGQVFHSGTGILAAFTTADFDPPREGYIQLLIDGSVVANLTPAALDSEGNRRIHLVLPEFPDGVHSIEARCVSTEHALLHRSGASFVVNGSSVPPPSKAHMLAEAPPALCRPVGFCDSAADCSGHGRCSDGACLCEGNWDGEHCEHSILDGIRYLPDVLPPLSPSFCHKVTQLRIHTPDHHARSGSRTNNSIHKYT
jgi:hypothetical protein